MQSRQVAARVVTGGRSGAHVRCQRSRLRADWVTNAVPHRPPVVGGARLGDHRPRCAGGHGHPGGRDMRGDTGPAGAVLRAGPVMRPSSSKELEQLCRGIKKSFVHFETRDSYGTETEQPHWAKWRRGEPDDFAWLEWWLEMLRGHRAAGRTCRRLRVVSEPVSEYQRWVLSHAERFVEAGEDISYVPGPGWPLSACPAAAPSTSSLTSWCCSCTTPAVASARPSRSPRTRRWCGPAERRSRPFGSWPYHFVTIDPSSSVTQARKELGARLRQLRKSA